MVYNTPTVFSIESAKKCEVGGEWNRPLLRRPVDARLTCETHYGSTLPTVAAPDIVTMDVEVAEEALNADGLVLGTVTVVTNAAAAGTVLTMDPVATTVVDIYSAVNVTVSDGLG